MKYQRIRHIMTIILLVAGLTPISAQWYVVSDTLPEGMTDLYFTNAQTGFAVGDMGIFKTADGGMTWERYSFQEGSDEQLQYNRVRFKSVYFCPAICSKGYAVGQDTLLGQGVCYETSDNGLSWQLFQPLANPPTSWNDIIVVNNTIFLGGNDGRVAVKHPFNVDWTVAFQPPAGHIAAIWFSGAAPGGLTATDQGLYYSMDIGESWQNVRAGVFSDVAASFTKGFAVTQQSVFRASPPTSTGTWQPVFALPDTVEARRLAILGFNINDICMGTNKGIYKRITDEVWELQPSTRDYAIECLFFVNANTGYAIASNGVCLKTTNGGGPTIPFADFSFLTSGCKGDSTTFINLGYSGNNYEWSVNGQVVEAPAAALPYRFDTAGVYLITLEASNGFYSNSYTRQVYITQEPDTLIALQPAQDTLCIGETVLLHFDSSEYEVDYYIYINNNPLPFDTLSGTGFPLTVNTPPIDTSSIFGVQAIHQLSGCRVWLPAQPVVEPVEPTTGLAMEAQTICAGDNLLLASRPGLAYAWSPAILALQPDSMTTLVFPDSNTVFTVTVAQPFCPAFVDTFVVDVHYPPVASIFQTGDTLFAMPGDAMAYQWFFNDQQLTDANGNYLLYMGEGVYHVVITDSLGCRSVSPSYFITGVDEPDVAVTCRVFPNPLAGRNIRFAVTPPETIHQLLIWDSRGRLLLEKTYHTDRLSAIDLELPDPMAAGWYSYSIVTWSGKNLNGLFLKNL